MSTVEIHFQNLAVVGYKPNSDECERLPMPHLGLDENACIHGAINLKIGGRNVPHMGFFGPHDVCLWEWLGNFFAVDEALRADENARFVEDGADQSCPAFVWERDGETGFLTIADCPIMGGQADSQWQKIPFLVADFFAAHANFRAQAKAFVVREAPHCGLEWWDDWGLGYRESK